MKLQWWEPKLGEYIDLDISQHESLSPEHKYRIIAFGVNIIFPGGIYDKMFSVIKRVSLIGSDIIATIPSM